MQNIVRASNCGDTGFPFFFGGTTGTTKLENIDMSPTSNKVVACGYSTSAPLVFTTSSVPVMMVTDNTGVVTWSKKFTTNPASTSF